ncbi:MAG: cell wall hydrolase [Alishewanella aestuarii]
MINIINQLALCAALSSTPNIDMNVSIDDCNVAAQEYSAALQSLDFSEDDRDAIARVAFAEAANQGDSGLAGVVYTIINRLISGQWGNNITAVVNARNQFEPVQRAGGWRQLPALSPTQRTRVDTIINLALEGRLPDLTNGALFFQNPDIVAAREADGAVSKGLTHFGGSTPSAVIRDHTFYASINNFGGARKDTNSPVMVHVERIPDPEAWDTYGQARSDELKQTQTWDVFTKGSRDIAVFGLKEEE